MTDSKPDAESVHPLRDSALLQSVQQLVGVSETVCNELQEAAEHAEASYSGDGDQILETLEKFREQIARVKPLLNFNSTDPILCPACKGQHPMAEACKCYACQAPSCWLSLHDWTCTNPKCLEYRMPERQLTRGDFLGKILNPSQALFVAALANNYKPAHGQPDLEFAKLEQSSGHLSGRLIVGDENPDDYLLSFPQQGHEVRAVLVASLAVLSLMDKSQKEGIVMHALARFADSELLTLSFRVKWFHDYHVQEGAAQVECLLELRAVMP